eukprot:gene7424-8246_t
MENDYSSSSVSSSCVISNLRQETLQLEIIDKNNCSRACGKFSAERGEQTSNRRHSFGNILLILIPIGAFCVPSAFIIASYIYANHEKTLLLPHTRTVPFISDIGNTSPQSGLFSFGLFLSSLFTLALVIVRFFQVRIFVTEVSFCANFFGLLLGISIVIGKTFVASFRLSEHYVPHFVGAGIYVLSSVAYVCMQLFVPLKNGGKFSRRLLLGLRALLLTGVICGTLLFGVFILPPLLKFNGAGYSVAQTGEWCFAVCKLLFMLTFVVEFWHFEPKFDLVNVNCQH